jgi:hypothetical protein
VVIEAYLGIDEAAEAAVALPAELVV